MDSERCPCRSEPLRDKGRSKGERMMDGPNGFADKVLKAADENGWILLEWSVDSPGYVTLEDSRGTTVEIRSKYGLDTERYVRQFKALPRDPHIDIKP